MMTTTATITDLSETGFAVAADAPAAEFTPCPLRDTLATLFSVAGVGALVKIVFIILAVVIGH